MYVVKDGQSQKIVEDAWPYWRDLGWSQDLDQDGEADTEGGDTSGLLPIADAPNASTEEVTNPYTGEGTVTALTFPEDTTVLAIKLEGDDFPRWLLFADSGDGLYMGDGTFDAFNDSGGGYMLFSNGEVQFVSPGGLRVDGGLVIQGGDTTVENLNAAAVLAASFGTGGVTYIDNTGFHLFDGGDNTLKHAVLTDGVLTWEADA